jgi:murein DD-endopeptidase MepM/ murein hydrolase activator NlpD
MQILIIFGPLNRVKNITFSKVHMVLIGFLLLAVLISIHWPWKPISGVSKEILHSVENKDQRIGGLPSGSEYLYETKLMQLKIRLDSLQNKLDELTLAKGGPLRSSYGKQGLIDRDESYSLRLDRAYVDTIDLDVQIDKAKKFQPFSLDAASAMLSAAPLPLPLKASSGMGHRIDPFTHQIAWHEGVDFQATHGTPILATGAGVVIRAAWDDEYGNVVDIQHQNFIVTRYAHAQHLLVKQGELVNKSQVIALVGSTGRSTGPHLHYEVLKNGKNLMKS